MEKSNEPEFRAFRKKVLFRGLIFCVFGFFAGLALNIPYVYILSIIGIMIAGIRLKTLKD